MGRRYLFLSIILHLVAPLLEREEKKKTSLEFQRKDPSPRHWEVPVQHSKVTLKQTLFQ